jgi:hypothetical protein
VTDPLVHPYTGEVLDRDNVPDEARIALLEVSFHHLQDAIAALIDSDGGKQGYPSKWSWHHVRDRERARLWAELRSFVDWLIDRYQPTGDVRIPPCWYRHPAAVEELTALMVAWRGAYCSTDRPSERAISWHQNCLWPTLERLSKRARWSQCGSRHKPPEGVVAALTDPEFGSFEDVGPGRGDPARARC